MRRRLLVALLTGSLILSMGMDPEAVGGLRRVLVRGLAAGTGRLPFSLAEAVLLIGGVTGAAALWRGRRRLRRLGLGVAEATGWLLLGAFWLFGQAHLVEPHSARLGLRRRSSPVRVLEELAHATLQRAELGLDLVPLAPEWATAQSVARAGVRGLAVRSPWLTGPDVPLKRPLLEGTLARWGISGVFFPWTVEPHVERGHPGWTLAFTMAHELAHLRGVAPEDEANFVAWQALVESPSCEARLAADLVLLRSALRALGRTHPEALETLRSSMSPRLLEVVAEIDRYWARWHGVGSRIGRGVNDLYLKAAGDPRGVESYGAFLDLVLATDWRVSLAARR